MSLESCFQNYFVSEINQQEQGGANQENIFVNSQVLKRIYGISIILTKIFFHDRDQTMQGDRDQQQADGYDKNKKVGSYRHYFLFSFILFLMSSTESKMTSLV